ncbi:MAG: phage tail protein [Cloacibacillus sp.]
MPKLRTPDGGEIITIGPGFIGLFAADTAPEGWLPMNGAVISRSTYSKLFAAIGTKYGAGDGSTSFGLPNTEDRFPRFAGNGLIVGQIQEDAIRNIYGDLSFRTLGDSVVVYGKSGAFYDYEDPAVATTGQMSGAHKIQGVGFSANRVVPTAAENRPKAIAFLACIKY